MESKEAAWAEERALLQEHLLAANDHAAAAAAQAGQSEQQVEAVKAEASKDITVLKAKLDGLRPIALHKRAVACEIDRDALDDAMAEEDEELMKPRIVALLLEHHKQKVDALVAKYYTSALNG